MDASSSQWLAKAVYSDLEKYVNNKICGKRKVIRKIDQYFL